MGCGGKELQMPESYDMFLEKEEVISPSEYLNLTEEQRKEIEDIRIVPPKIGSGSFGMFRVIRKFPAYRVRKSSHGR